MNLQNRELSIQTQGDDVKLLHTELQILDYIIPSNELEQNIFGNSTHQAIQDFQKKHDLEPTGIVDEKTARLINEAVDALKKEYVVKGQALQQDDTPVPKVTVKAFDRDLRREEFLGAATINEQGEYSISYTADKFSRAEKKRADVIIRAFKNNIQIGESKTFFNAAETETIDLVVTLPTEPKLSEYEKLLAALSPVVQDLPPAQLNDNDIQFLLQELYDEQIINKRRLNILSQGARLAMQTNLPIEVFYGLARVQQFQLPLKLDMFLALETSSIQQALLQAIEKTIIPAAIEEALENILGRFEQLKLEHGIYIRCQITGRLLNAETVKPLIGFKVHATYQFPNEKPKNLGYQLTKRNGDFSFSFITHATLPPEVEGYTLQFTIKDGQGEDIHQTSVTLTPNHEGILDIKVPVQALPTPPTHPLTELRDTLSLELPEQLLLFLAEKGIKTLEDVRKKGGISQLENLPVENDAPIVKWIEGLARLQVLSSDIQTNNKLIHANFYSITEISRTTRSQFIDRTKDQFSEKVAVQVHSAARLQTDYLNNILMSLKTDFVNGFPSKIPGITNPTLPRWFQRKCSCKECESAVSPLAYLADLLDYSLVNIKNTGTDITLDELSDMFHQPFGELPASCEQLNRKVRKIRITIEVLREYLNTISHAPIEATEKRYYIDAYKTLLYQLGTSVDEIRQISSLSEVEMALLTKRLGIPAENIPELRLDPAAAHFEQRLEVIFGLPSTLRNPLDTIPTSLIQHWRIQSLHSEWELQDYPDPEPEDARPIIDPDLIGPGDLVEPIAGNRAFDLFQNRERAITDNLHEIETRITDHGISSAVDFVASVALTELQSLKIREDEGENIETDVEGYGFSLSSFHRLMELVTLHESGESILATECEEVHNILLGVWKNHQYANWRMEERGGTEPTIILSQEYFQIIEDEPELIPWRATIEDRQTWQDKLQLRIEQEKTIIDGLKSAVDATEVASLELLREGLIAATGQSVKQLSKLLLIDCEGGACQQTTRIAQAIEIIQKLLFGLRTGQLTDVYPDLSLVTDYFDEEWKWLETYENWRSAMFVYMYPENILYPQYRKFKTPVFNEIIQEIRDTPQLTPESAHAIAMKYEDYFQDVADLKIEAAVHEVSEIQDINEEIHGAQKRDLVFMFARGSKTNTVYVSWFESGEKSYGSQCPWIPIKEFENVIKIIGATAHNDHIYLFIHVQERNTQKLLSTKIGLSQIRFSINSINEVILPAYEIGDELTFSAILKQNQILTSKPQLTVKMPSGAIYTLIFDEDDINSSVYNWERISLRKKDINQLLAMIALSNDQYCIIAQSTTDKILYRIFGDWDDGRWHNLPDADGLKWIGGFGYEFSYKIYIFLQNISSNSSGYHVLDIDDSIPNTTFIDNIDDFISWIQEVSDYDLNLFMNNYICEWTTGGRGTDDPTHHVENLYRVLTYYNQVYRDSDFSYIYDRRFFDKIPGWIDGFIGELINEDSEWNIISEAVEQFSALMGWGMPGVSLAEALKRIANQLPFEVKIRNRDEVRIVSDIQPFNQFEWTVHPPNKGLTIAEGPTTYYYMLYKLHSENTGTYFSNFVIDSEGDFEISEMTRIAPSLTGPFNIPEHLSQSDLQQRRNEILEAYEMNADAPSSVLVYLEEAWYFIPLYIALKLQKRRQFIAALDWYRTVYDYTFQPAEERNIFYGLALGYDPERDFERGGEWLLDTFNPHQIATSRGQTYYTRITLISIIRCLNEYADAEFTFDTVESIGRAQLLYQTALELLELNELKQLEGTCDKLVEEIDFSYISREWQPAFKLLLGKLKIIGSYKDVTILAQSFRDALESDESTEACYAHILFNIQEITENQPGPLNFGTLLETNSFEIIDAHRVLVQYDNVFDATKNIRAKLFPEERESSIPIGLEDEIEAEDSDIVPIIGVILDDSGIIPFPPLRPWINFRVPPNPVLTALKNHAELSLLKIRTCRNYAGMNRDIEPYSAPTDLISGMPGLSGDDQLILTSSNYPPTLYRYEVIIERAKHLADRAAQMEAAFISAMEKYNAEYYNLLNARQDLQLANGTVRLQDLRLQEANNSKLLALQQKKRSQIQADHYNNMIKGGTSALENASLVCLGTAAALYTTAGGLSFLGGLKGGISSAFSSFAQAASTTSSLLSTIASYERREQEWRFQRALAEHEIDIGTQQVRLSKDRSNIVRHERLISKMQTNFAEATAAFLANKFTNADLYEWMSDVLEGVYNFFLQQATVTAKIAESQLAFERQESVLSFIQTDYWEATSDDVINSSGTGENIRKGLTGSARLLEDIYRLDQYRFETEKRKLQLSKTFSLSRLAPAEFQLFRETGVMRFDTPMELFDWDFPGHYLRLIKRVRTSVIALIPPISGIRVTLSTAGLSKVIIGNQGLFQQKYIRRSPESVALTSPDNATGLFELTAQPQEMLLPFEGMGVDTSWEFRMPKASNLFDYTTIADVLITIDYTALNSYDYQKQIIKKIDNKISAERPFSFKHHFPDQWYDLHNPELTASPMTIKFEIGQVDFPPNIEDIKIQQLVLYFAHSQDTSIEIPNVNLTLNQNGVASTAYATPLDGIISTRRGNAPEWLTNLLTKSPVGDWTLSLPPDDSDLITLFKNEEIEDILFVITYSGSVEEWPE